MSTETVDLEALATATVDEDFESVEGEESLEDLINLVGLGEGFETGQDTGQELEETVDNLELTADIIPELAGEPNAEIAASLEQIAENQSKLPQRGPPPAAILRRTPARSISLQELSTRISQPKVDPTGNIRIMRLQLLFTGGQPVQDEYIGYYWDRGFLVYPVPLKVAKEISIQTGADILTIDEAVAASAHFDRPIAAFDFLHEGGKKVAKSVGEEDLPAKIEQLHKDKRTQGGTISRLEKDNEELVKKLALAEKRLANKAVQASSGSSNKKPPTGTAKTKE